MNKTYVKRNAYETSKRYLKPSPSTVASMRRGQ
jgi:hypothetical protein